KHPERQDDPTHFGGMGGKNQVAACISMGFQQFGDLRECRCLPSLPWFRASDGNIEMFNGALPWPVCQQVANDGDAAQRFQNFASRPVPCQSMHFMVVRSKRLDEMTADESGPAGDKDFQRHTHGLSSLFC